ncbi:MAG: hypothetical protein R2759_15360 [Bacteroidales bacterium]
MKKQNLILLSVLFILMGLLTSCSSLRISADYDKTVDFSKYKTIEFYGWAKESDKLLNGMDKTVSKMLLPMSFIKEG